MSCPRILVLAELKPQEMAEQLAKNYDVVRDINAAADVEMVLTSGSVGLSAEQMAKMPNLRLIAVNGVGVDAVDLSEAKKRDIQVTTTPDVLSSAVAEMALGLAFASARRIAEGDRFIRDGKWATDGKLPLGSSVLGRRAGILGYGRIGRKLADLLRGLGLEVFYTARSRKSDTPDTYCADVISLAHECELLFVTASANADNNGLVGRETLSALGTNGIVINVARGPLVDAEALALALTSGMIAGAALDVFDDEPHVPEALMKAPNCVLTPHVGSATSEARRAMAQLVLDNLAAYVAGKPLLTPYEV